MASHVALDTMRRALGRPSPVRSLVFKVTRRCNLFCEMCYTHEGETTGEVTPEEAAVFLAQAALSNCTCCGSPGASRFCVRTSPNSAAPC